MRRVVVDLTQVLNGEGLTLWLVILDNVQTSSLFMSLASLSKATGMDTSNIRKRLAVFVKAGWLIEIGFQKNGKYQATKTYEVVLDVLRVGQVTHSLGGSHGGSKGGSKGGSRNIANPAPQEENTPNPITNPIPNPNPTPRKSADNTNTPPHRQAGEEERRIENIVSLCIELECNNTPNVGKGLREKFHRDYRCLVSEELKRREWLTDKETADVCYATRHHKPTPHYSRPKCGKCGGRNIDEHGRSQICQTDKPPYIYVVCPKCKGDGFQPLSDMTRTLFKNLNTKGHTT